MFNAFNDSTNDKEDTLDWLDNIVHSTNKQPNEIPEHYEIGVKQEFETAKQFAGKLNDLAKYLLHRLSGNQ